MLTIGTLSDDDGVPVGTPFLMFFPFCLLCLTVFLGLSPSEFCFFRPVGGFSTCSFRLHEPEGRLGTGLETTFLGPWGLPGFLFFPAATDFGLASAFPILSFAGILSL